MGIATSMSEENVSCTPTKDQFIDDSIAEKKTHGATDGCSCQPENNDKEKPSAPRGNLEVLTPRGPLQEPYALADGPDVFGPPIHDCLEPRGPAENRRDGRFFPPSKDSIVSQFEIGRETLDTKLPTRDEVESDSSNEVDADEHWPAHLHAYAATCRYKFGLFLDRVECGMKCWVRLSHMSKPQRAIFICHLPSGTFRVVVAPCSSKEIKVVRIPGICSIRIDGIVSGMLTKTSMGSLHFDTSDGAFDLLLEGLASANACDDFVDCVAILIATLRHRARRRSEPPPDDEDSGFPREELRRAWKPGDVRADMGLDMLRPHGKSLAAEHLTGHAGALLAALGEPVVQCVRGEV